MHGRTLIIDAFWVSNKPFPTAQYSGSKEGKPFYDFYSGTARYLGWMDLVLLKNIVQKSNITHIILQNLDELGKIAQVTKTVKVCVAYSYNKFVVKQLPNIKELVHCEPIYQDIVFGGWDSSEEKFELHMRAQHYIRYLLLQTHVTYITYANEHIKVTACLGENGDVNFTTESNL